MLKNVQTQVHVFLHLFARRLVVVIATDTKQSVTTAARAVADKGNDVLPLRRLVSLARNQIHQCALIITIVNLVDFDMLWGHRRDVAGYAKEIEMFDEKLGELLSLLKEDDLLILTADHGNDPVHAGTDHTREKVPFLAYSPSMKGNGKLDETDTFAVVGATIADNFGVEMPEGTIGESLLKEL